MKKIIYLSLVFTCLSFVLSAQIIERRSVLVKFKEEVTAFQVQGVFVMPNEVLEIETLFEGEKSEYSLSSEHGSIDQVESNKWKWTAPASKGVYPVYLMNEQHTDSTLLNCIVLVPYEKMDNGRINAYRIGAYPNSKNKLYKNPEGFIEVTKENELTLVSPNYRLKDFLCKQQGSYPKYVVLKERGLIKLEKVQQQLHSQGVKFERFSFISGYRTPFYNRSIGNVKNSRHIFGDAYDIYIDTDSDSRMDDLNGDGQLTKKDALFLYYKVDGMYKDEWFKPFIGGLGVYGPNSRHGGFIHMDSRGYKARWGL